MLFCLVTFALYIAPSSASLLNDLINLFTFDSRRFKYEGLIDAGSLGLDGAQGTVVAIADTDGNQILDLVVLSPDQTAITIYKWNRNAFAFQRSATPSVNSPHKIVNVVPGDFNYDGRLDLLVMSQTNPGGWWSDDDIHLDVYAGNGQGEFSAPVSLESAHGVQPMILDANGTMRVDLLGLNKESQPQLWLNDASTGGFNIQAFAMAQECRLSNPHSNAFVDLNGDCLADLFLTCVDPHDTARRTYQIYTNDKQNGFVFSQSGSFPVGTGQISFADIDRDGTIDMVFPSCNYGTCYINIAYNKQIPLCTVGSTSDCRDAADLCTPDPTFSFDLTVSETNDAFQQFKLSSLLPFAPRFIMEDKSFAGPVPIAIKIGDYNQDGYPDLLLVSSSSSSASSGQVSLMQSLSCTSKTCSNAASRAGRRHFERVQKGADALNNIRAARIASFFDIDEQGSLDILVQRDGTVGGISKKFTFVKNNYFHEAFFLKALVLNGACDGKCPASKDGQRAYDPYGVSYSGASYKFTVFDPTGARRATSVGQYPQTSYMSLLLPYSYFGLGITNNYVENLFVGSTRHQAKHYTNIEGVIPNSQILIQPYQPQTVLSPDSWTKSLYLHPGDWIPGVVSSLLGAILALGITVVVLHMRENREDDAQRRKRQTILNFDAL